VSKLRVLFVCLAALLAPLAVAVPAQAAIDCKQAQVCLFADQNYKGTKAYYWEDGLQLSQKLDVRMYGYSKNTTSVINYTSYYFHIWNAGGSHRCLPPGYGFRHVGDDYNDKITAIGLYTNWC
jgi:hypothetical protein